jgi:hypothetical protein
MFKIIPNMHPNELINKILYHDTELKAFGLILDIENSLHDNLTFSFLKDLQRALKQNEEIVLAKSNVKSGSPRIKYESLKVELMCDLNLSNASSYVKNNMTTAKMFILDLLGLPNNPAQRQEIENYINVFTKTTIF